MSEQPLFMTYDAATDEKVPLTQERLDGLLGVERQYFMMIEHVRSSHKGFVKSIGGTPQPWTDEDKKS